MMNNNTLLEITLGSPAYMAFLDAFEGLTGQQRFGLQAAAVDQLVEEGLADYENVDVKGRMYDLYRFYGGMRPTLETLNLLQTLIY